MILSLAIATPIANPLGEANRPTAIIEQLKLCHQAGQFYYYEQGELRLIRGNTQIQLQNSTITLQPEISASAKAFSSPSPLQPLKSALKSVIAEPGPLAFLESQVLLPSCQRSCIQLGIQLAGAASASYPVGNILDALGFN